MTAPFDVQALYQASQLQLPPDPAAAQQLWAANAADLAAAADEIRACWGRVERLEEAFVDLYGKYDHSMEDCEGHCMVERATVLADLNEASRAALAPAEGRVAG